MELPSMYSLHSSHIALAMIDHFEECNTDWKMYPVLLATTFARQLSVNTIYEIDIFQRCRNRIPRRKIRKPARISYKFRVRVIKTFIIGEQQVSVECKHLAVAENIIQIPRRMFTHVRPRLSN